MSAQSPLVLDLCSSCAKARGARTSQAVRYEELTIGIWRGACADCGKRGSSGDDSGITRFRIASAA